MSLMNVVLCADSSGPATGRSLLQWSPTECVAVNECDQVRRWFARRGHINPLRTRRICVL